MMVGGIGPEAIAAVGITNQPKFILLAVIFSAERRRNRVVARRKGTAGYARCKQLLKAGDDDQSGAVRFDVGCRRSIRRPILLFAGAAQTSSTTRPFTFRF